LEPQWPGSYGQLFVADLEEGTEKLPFLGGVPTAVLDTFYGIYTRAHGVGAVRLGWRRGRLEAGVADERLERREAASRGRCWLPAGTLVAALRGRLKGCRRLVAGMAEGYWRRRTPRLGARTRGGVAALVGDTSALAS
jgi:hypothetical protein